MGMETAWQSRERQPSGRVYCYSEPHIRLEDGTPLYLEWLLEGADLALYVVPAELGGWRRRYSYQEARSTLQPVPAAEARIIISLLCDCIEHAQANPADRVKEDLVARTSQVPSLA